ncbi:MULTISPECIES: dolichyl-phosphate beta-glucosyltransferase [unclassified Frankia]|uniref:dolichyl-phosphate beta-glucosyltransferase n=1 Tax=unclassified Frankia TaxID=2632575 RepID=UPI002AD46A0C|nr:MULTISPECIES: dolichyl-phosphate beta-glucosyltransferase [unclassified Frankia]
MDHVPVSIVIPAYNEAHRLPEALPRLVAVVSTLAGAEVILVDDGSTDRTAEVAERLLSELPRARVVSLPWNSGKGTAIRTGVAMARGASIVFMDADMASDLNDLPPLLAALNDAEVALGSRRIGDNALRTSGRRMGSWAFNRITRTLAGLDVADTQCGFKAFRHAEAKLLFSLSRSTGFGFDVEVIALARSMGYRIAEVPVHWSEMAGGTFRVTRHTPAMLVDVMRARRYRRRVPVLPTPLHLRTSQAAPSVVLQAVPSPLAEARRLGAAAGTGTHPAPEAEASRTPGARVLSMGAAGMGTGGMGTGGMTADGSSVQTPGSTRTGGGRDPGLTSAPREVV